MRGEKGITKVSDLFEKYTRRLVAPEGSVIEAFQDVVEDLTGARLEKKQCSYSSGTRTLTLTASGPLKSEVLLRKKEILTHLKGRLGDRNAPETIL